MGFRFHILNVVVLKDNDADPEKLYSSFIISVFKWSFFFVFYVCDLFIRLASIYQVSTMYQVLF